jgi:hypothetical protein
VPWVPFFGTRARGRGPGDARGPKMSRDKDGTVTPHPTDPAGGCLGADRSVFEEAEKVTGAVGDTDDENAVDDRAVQEEIVSDGETTKAGGELSAASPHFRHPGKGFGLLLEHPCEADGGSGAVVVQVVKDLFEVALGLLGALDAGRQLPFGFLAFRLPTRANVASMSRGATSPRSACSIPTATNFLSSSSFSSRSWSRSSSRRRASRTTSLAERYRPLWTLVCYCPGSHQGSSPVGMTHSQTVRLRGLDTPYFLGPILSGTTPPSHRINPPCASSRREGPITAQKRKSRGLRSSD